MSNTINLQDQWDYWYPRVYGYFYKRITDKTTVDDLTANVLSTVFLAKNIINMNGYVWKVAHNYLVRYIDTKAKSPIMVGWDDNLNWIPDEQDYDLENYVSPVYNNKMANMKLCIDNQITSEEDKQLIQLSIYEEKNSSEIEALIGVKSNTVRQKLSRLLRKVKENCRDLWSTPTIIPN
jgi:RNA polymerase sigma factor (sigma-70 family)